MQIPTFGSGDYMKKEMFLKTPFGKQVEVATFFLFNVAFCE